MEAKGKTVMEKKEDMARKRKRGRKEEQKGGEKEYSQEHQVELSVFTCVWGSHIW